jgi:hypothetical protein
MPDGFPYGLRPTRFLGISFSNDYALIILGDQSGELLDPDHNVSARMIPCFCISLSISH